MHASQQDIVMFMAGQNDKAGMQGGGIGEEEEPAMGGAMMVPQAFGISALTVTGDLLLFIGLLFSLLGISAFVTDLLRIKGSGEFLLGLFLILVAAVLLSRSREQMKKIMEMQQKQRILQMGKPSPKKDAPTDSYR